MSHRYRLLPICAALALGEACAASAPTLADIWPLLAGITLLTLLFGYGTGLDGWHHFMVFLLGMTIFYAATQERERQFRESPWLRDARQRMHPPATASPTLTDIKQGLSQRVGLGLSHDRAAADLNRAILLGDRAALPKSTRRMFVYAGTSHVFAISGLHVMIVAKVLMTLMLLTFFPYRLHGLIVLPVLWGYVMLIGSPPSAVRAALMASFYLTAPLFWRRPDSIVAWSQTFLLIHLIRPDRITDLSTQLSFAVMLALLLAGRAVRPLGNCLVSTLLVALSAWAAGVPIIVHAFGRITPGGLVANLALLPAAGISVATGALGIITSFVSETLARHLNNASALFTDAMVLISQAVAATPGSNFTIRRWSILECAGWYLAMALIGFAIHRFCAQRRGPF